MSPFAAAIILAVLLFLSAGWWLVRGWRGGIVSRLWPPFAFRPLPWTFIELCAVWFILLGLIVLVQTVGALQNWHQNTPESAPRINRDVPPDTDLQKAHWVILLLMDRPNFGTLLFVIATTALLGPMVEEVVFRLFLQGWLHTQEMRWRRLRRRAPQELARFAQSTEQPETHKWKTGPATGWQVSETPSGFRYLPIGSLSILVTTLIFSSLHARSVESTPAPEKIAQLLAERSVAYSIFLVLVTGYCVLRDPLTPYRLGLRRGMFWRDCLLGLEWFAATAFFIYGTQAVFTVLLPEYVVADPVSILLVGLIVGVLFARTGRILPSIVFHISLNSTSLILAYLASVFALGS